MNKKFALLLAVLLISSASANFLNLLLDNQKDNGEDHREDHGEHQGEDDGEDDSEDDGEDHGEDSGEQQFSGSWNDEVDLDNGKSFDQGEYTATLYTYDNGEWRVSGNFERLSFCRVYSGEDSREDHNLVYRDRIYESGEFSHTEYNKHGGRITREEVFPTILKRVKRNH